MTITIHGFVFIIIFSSFFTGGGIRDSHNALQQNQKESVIKKAKLAYALSCFEDFTLHLASMHWRRNP